MTIHVSPDGMLRAMTIREPFATLIVMGIKVVENRKTPVPKNLPLPATIAIHAGNDDSTLVEDGEELCKDDFLFQVFDNPYGEACVPGKEIFYLKTIVGLVDIIGCIHVEGKSGNEIDEALAPFEPHCCQFKPGNSFSEWANGPYCYILANARRFRTGIVSRGQLGLWRLTEEQQQMVIKNSADLLTGIHDLPTIPIAGEVKCAGNAKS